MSGIRLRLKIDSNFTKHMTDTLECSLIPCQIFSPRIYSAHLKCVSMVLQNKYKARASRRYRAAKGIPPRHTVNGENESPGVCSEIAKHHPRSDTSLRSNDWRYAQPESDDEEAEPEPEVDLTKLNAKVASMDMNSSTQAQILSSDSDSEDSESNAKSEQLRALDSVDWNALRREKEDAEMARALRERFKNREKARPNAANWRRDGGIQRPSEKLTRLQPSRTTSERNPAHKKLTEEPLRSSEVIPKATSRPPMSVLLPTESTMNHHEPMAQDMDDFLASIDAHTIKPKAEEKTVQTVRRAPPPKEMQDLIDDILG